MKMTTMFKACVSALALTTSIAANAGMIGVFGNYNQNALIQNLEGQGHTVTYLGTDVSQDLSAYDSVWGVSAFDILSSAETTFLTNYLAQGGGLYLTGERPCCEALNDSVETFVNSVVSLGGVQIGNLGDAGSSMQINTGVLGGLATTPNNLVSWTPNASGAISGVSGDNIFASTGANGTGRITAAAWNESDLAGNSGRLVVMMDVNWHTDRNSQHTMLLQNVERFLSTPAPVSKNPIPEPATFAIFGLGLAGLAFRRRLAS